MFTYSIERTDLIISLYVNTVQIISFFYSSMRCLYFPLMTIIDS